MALRSGYAMLSYGGQKVVRVGYKRLGLELDVGYGIWEGDRRECGDGGSEVSVLLLR